MSEIKSPLPNFNFSNFENLENNKNTIKQTIDVDNIKFNPNNYIYNQHDTDEDITELAEFIKLTKIYDAIVVKKVSRNSYEIISGEKRFRALTEKLGYNRVDCIILINPTPEQEEGIFDGPNLTQRTLTDEQKFNGYLRLQKTLENNSEINKYKKLFDISSYKRAQFERIIKNAPDEKIKQYQNNELSFSDLKDAAEAQRRLNQEQKRVNEAVKIYSDSKGNPNTHYYIDRNNNLIFRVEQRNYKNNVMYAVKEKDYTLNLPETWTRTRELPECDTQEEMQTLLDKYAVVYELEECSAEEYISLLEKASKQKSENKKNPTKKTDIKEKIPADEKNLLKKLGISKDSFDDESADYLKTDEEISFQDDVSQPNSNTSSEHKQAEHKQEKSSYDNDTTSVEQEKNPQIDLIANNYALNLLYKGREIETGNIIRRGRLIVNSQENRYFLVQGDVQIQEQVLQPNNVNAYELSCYAYEVEPSSVVLEN